MVKKAKKKAPAKKKTKRDKPGQPPYKVNELHRGMVIAFKAAGYTNEDIAKKIGIHRQTIAKYYGTELEQAARDYEFRAINNILTGIKKGDKSDSKWWLQRRTNNFHDTQKHELIPTDDPATGTENAMSFQQRIIESHEQRK